MICPSSFNQLIWHTNQHAQASSLTSEHHSQPHCYRRPEFESCPYIGLKSYRSHLTLAHPDHLRCFFPGFLLQAVDGALSSSGVQQLWHGRNDLRKLRITMWLLLDVASDLTACQHMAKAEAVNPDCSLDPSRELLKITNAQPHSQTN